MAVRSTAAAAVIALGLLAPLIARGAEADAYRATGSPAAVQPESTKTYTITLANEASSPDSARRATIRVDRDFSDPSQLTAETSAAGACSAATWTVNFEDSRISAVSPGEDVNALCTGGVLTVTFRAKAPATEKLYTWETELRRGSTTFVRRGPEPTVRVDGTRPPAPSIAGGPASPTNQRSASFVFSDSEAGLAFSCRLGGGNFAQCTSPKAYPGLSDGAHAFAVRAIDAAGNTSTAATHSWTVDTLAPDTTISSGPETASSSGSATFTFTSTEDRSSFTCSVDGAAFAPCASPHTYGALPDGAHTFRVRSTDAAGNTDPSAAASTWTVNTRVPTRVDQTPPGSVRNVAKSVRYRLLKLRWKKPSDEDFNHVVVVVGKNPRRPPTTRVYRGAGTSYTNSKFRNGLYYRYAITSYDRAGNASRKVGVVVPTSALLTSPRVGARLRRAPLLDWASVPKATYYNVQLYLGSKKVLTAWPSRSSLRLKPTWPYQDGLNQDGLNRLQKGKYQWYVWPGFGRRSKVDYGHIVGQSTFVIAG